MIRGSTITFASLIFILLFQVSSAEAATLRLSPDTGVYTAGKPFTVSVLLNTEGKSVNAADGKLSFNSRELQVVGVSRGASIFSLWTEEPSYSNSAGTVTFGGGSPSGYKGSAGTIVTITFRSLAAGTPKVNFAEGSALAANGLGTNVLTSMSGGTYTIAAEADSPAPEYIPPANTPQAPHVSSATHPDQSAWYKETTAKLSWDIPAGVTTLRTLLDENPGTVPTIVYNDLMSEKTLEDLPEGESYFHIQFKNADGWGRITHYRLGVDTEPPASFTITEGENSDPSDPSKVLAFSFTDISPVTEYKIQIDGKDPILYEDEAHAKSYRLASLAPGYHTFVVEAFDSAGNSAVANYSLTIEAFEKPVFTEYPTRINTEVIPAIKGTTRPDSIVTITITKPDGGAIDAGGMTIESDAQGSFTFIPDRPFDLGVYDIRASAVDRFGRASEVSDPIRIIVEKPGYIALGSLMVSVLSVLVPLIALLVLLVFGSWYLWHRLLSWRKRVRKETLEAEEKLALEFGTIVKHLNTNIAALRESRKGKLTKAETDLISEMERDLKDARARIEKEIEDIEEVIT